MEWWEGQKVCRSWSRLLDISHGGASLMTECLPPLDRPIWLRLEEPAQTDWVTARVVWHDAEGKVGVNFRQTCPFFFNAATLGLDFGGLLDAYLDEEE